MAGAAGREVRSGGGGDSRVTLVVITRDRRDELLRVLGLMTGVAERPRIIVVDNGSADGSADAVARDFPAVELIRARENLGALGRNLAVERVTTPYVAFCDDDTWWDSGALARAADLLDAHPDVASVTGRILVEPGGAEDPITPELRHSPVPAPPGLPGPALLGILAGASMLRAAAFRDVGGFSARLRFGGEEELLSLDLAADGWWLCWAEDVVVHHRASALRDPTERRRLGIRNTLWTTWLRRPWRDAARRTAAVLRSLPRDRTSAGAVAAALAGLPWVLRERRPVPERVAAGLRLLEEPQRTSAARRYVG
ncbi:glycosyltransferase family 2 protein [Actinomadura flavalba]|uniref:glycosyltransferase family 2 protein n=1 Tax=Actinomadura flavalba TaxID=1120938 RepID=UPI000361209C|nr:glycosyltransferase [Actinomadura flavalba]